MLIYADDIVLYAIGQDPSRTLRKLQNCLDRLTEWCTAFKLSVSPEKSLAIDFSRRKEPDTHVKVRGCEFEWSKAVKILGVWFGRSLIFNQHFAYLRAKAVKRLNYLRAVVSCSRGVRSYHMLRITNALDRSLLEYACSLFLKACSTSLNTLEVIQNAALRTATGLPKCTPIPLLRREADASSLTSRFRCLTHRFLIRQLSLPRTSWSNSLGVSSHSDDLGHLTAAAAELLSLYNVDPKNLIQFTWPHSYHSSPDFQIIIDGLPFHTPNLPSSAITQAWLSWRFSLHPCEILASDASKNATKTAVAIYNDAANSSAAFLTNHLNSIFTAEAIALYLAISNYVRAGGTFILLTGSLSTLRALQNITLRSPRIILLIYNLICKLLATGSISLTLVWCPGHSGIPPNELVDSLARDGPYMTCPINWIAPEDLLTHIRRSYEVEKAYTWLQSDYFVDFPHLNTSLDYRSWTNSRQEDVWISRWRTRMWLTNYRLHKMHLVSSPLCPVCCLNETPDHILLYCSRYNSARISLFRALGIVAPVSYSEVMIKAVQSRKGISALSHFSAVVYHF